MFSAIHSVVLVLAASAPAGLPQGSVGTAQIPKTLLSAGSVSKKNQEGPVRFGPKGCVSTWLNDQARCMIKTECKEKDIDNYNFKFICIDESGEHVRHVFGKGSFDPEETFDTLVTCTSCTADADDLMVSAKQSKGGNNTKTADGPTSTNALLRQIVADVGELKVEMANATQNVERLNAAVFKDSTTPPAAPSATPAPEQATPAPSSLVHRGASALRAKGKLARMNAIKARAKASKSHTHKIRRRHIDSDVDATDQEDAQDRYQRVDNAQDSTDEEEVQSRDDSGEQDDSQDQDDVRGQDDIQQQEDDDVDRRDQADVGDADSEDEQRDDEHDQIRDDDRSADRDQDDGDRDVDDDGRHEENVD